MCQSFRFGIISDPHIALPETISDNPNRFHWVEVSIPAFEFTLQELAHQSLDFLLLPGDLTQHGERVNHRWLVQRLSQLPYPVYVVPGNHDVITADGCDRTLSLPEFTHWYQPFGYAPDSTNAPFQQSPAQPYYARQVLPNVWLIGLNSIAFDPTGEQLYSGLIDTDQLQWLAEILPTLTDCLVIVMVHHNVVEHLPGQHHHSMGKRYMVQNAHDLITLLQKAGVSLTLTGHLHVQDVAQRGTLWEITTGSLVSYPHPYRLIQASQQDDGGWELFVETQRISSLPQWENMAEQSREWMGDRSFYFMHRFLTEPPICAPAEQAAELAPHLRYFWADISAGDALFNFDHFPPSIRQHLQQFGALDEKGNPRLIDNQTVLKLNTDGSSRST